MVNLDSFHCNGCEHFSIGSTEKAHHTEINLSCDKYWVDVSVRKHDWEGLGQMREAINLCIQDKQRYLLLNISRKIAKLDANYEQPK
jgi:hypothetical protein